MEHDAPPTPPTPLPTRLLGTHGPRISILGAGTWAIGGGENVFGWGPQRDEDSVAAIRHAVELGVTWIDTAAVYGFGHAEEVVGAALRTLPPSDRPLVATKCGLPWAPGSSPYEDPVHSLEPGSIRTECEQSLRRLGVERIDLYQFHWPDVVGTPVEDSWGEMRRLVDEGKVRWAGVSNFDIGLLERCERILHVDSLQPPFSMIRRGAAADVIPWCARNGTGVIVYSPMQSGILTDGFSRERVEAFAAGDWRRRMSAFSDPQLTRNLALRDALVPIAARHDVPVAAIAVAWAVAWPGVTGAIVGARSPAQVDGWIRAAEVALTAEDLAEIARAIADTGAGEGPAAVDA